LRHWNNVPKIDDAHDDLLPDVAPRRHEASDRRPLWVSSRRRLEPEKIV